MNFGYQIDVFVMFLWHFRGVEDSGENCVRSVLRSFVFGARNCIAQGLSGVGGPRFAPRFSVLCATSGSGFLSEQTKQAALMTGSSVFLFLALVNLSLTGVGAVQVRNKVNPIRRVVTLLQEMAKKITEEGEQEAAMYENLECYCGTTSQELKTNVIDATRF